MKSFIIHRDSMTERKDCVNKIVSLTNAEVVEAIWFPLFPPMGCLLSHIKVARMAEGEYLVFEDDCHVLNEDFMKLDRNADIVYYGINGSAFQTKPIECEHYWGTHAVYISDKVRRLLLEHWEKEISVLYPKGFPAIDEMLSVFIKRYDLSMKIYNAIEQKKGLLSSVTGRPRR